MTIPYCSAVNTGLFVSVKGQVGLCCSGSSGLGNIRNESIDSIFNKPRFIEITKNLSRGLTDSYCSGCDNVEKTSPTASQRYAFNDQFPNTQSRKIQLIDVRWSNVCNLSCRYCNPHDSSEWQKLHKLPIETVNRDYTESLFQEITRHKHTIEAAYMLGGEPLLQKHNERLLDIIEPTVKIDIITNMSVNLKNNKVYQKLIKFPQVHWNISFDNVKDKFEYVRQGANWNTFTDNIQRLCDDFGTHRVSFHPVYHIWNAHHLAEYYEFADTRNFRVNWQLALPKIDYEFNLGTDSFTVFGHNQSIIDMAINEIDQLNINDPILNEIKQSLHDNQLNPVHGKKFLEWTRQMEQFMPPKKSFRELWPELNTLLQI